MLTRYFILVISVLHIKEIRCLQNNSNSVSNIILNNLNGGQSQGLLQKSLNQIASNHGLPVNLQQILNSRQAANGQQQQNTQQNVFTKSPTTVFIESTPSPSLQPVFQQSSTATPTKGYHQQIMVQGPVSTAPVCPNCNGINNANNVDHQNLAMGNVQILQQQIPSISPQTIITQQPVMTPQTYQTVTIPSSNQPVSFPSTLNTGNVNTQNEMSFTYPQNQQVVTTGLPTYIVDGSQSTCVQTSQFSPVNNPPMVLYSTPQNPQGLDLSYSELANQLQIPNAAPSLVSAITPTNQQPILDTNSLAYSPYPYAALLPAITQMASNIPNSGSKPSSLKALLPLILNILKERLNNNCDCCQNCGCNKNNPLQGGNGYEKQKRHGHKPKPPNRHGNDISAELENRNEIKNKTSRSRYGKNKKVKYEDSYEDYENDDYYD